VVVGDVVTEQVCLRSDNEGVRLGGSRQPAGRQATDHLVNVEQTHITLTTQLLHSTVRQTDARPPTVRVMNEHLDAAFNT